MCSFYSCTFFFHSITAMAGYFLYTKLRSRFWSFKNENLKRVAKLMWECVLFKNQQQTELVSLENVLLSTSTSGEVLCLLSVPQLWNASTSSRAAASNDVTTSQPIICMSRRAYWTSRRGLVVCFRCLLLIFTAQNKELEVIVPEKVTWPRTLYWKVKQLL